MPRFVVMAVALLTFSLAAAAQAPRSGALPPAAAQAMKSIDAWKIRAHVRFLSHDLLEGRGTGQRGGDLAAEYIATQFALYGLKPAGDEAGSYLQKVPLVGIATDSAQTTYALVPDKGEPMPLKFADDFVALDETQSPTSDVDAPVLFLGYGIVAPEFGWNDYKGADVKGKVLMMFVNEPPSKDPKFFKGEALTYYGRWTYKYEQAARMGAAGVILIHETGMASYGWDVVRSSWSGEKSFLRDNDPKLKVASWVQLEVARKALAASGQDLNNLMNAARSRDFKPIPLALRLKAHMVSKVRQSSSANVVGIIMGSDPQRRDQAVIYTAHYDHLGIRPEKPGDNIYNGADDNATGVGTLLEMARAFAQARQKPARSIIFAAVTAEEQGLRGSEYLGKNPPVPAGKIVLNLNFDDLPPLGEPEEVEVSGAERTSFLPVVEKTARDFGFEIRPDPNPNAGSYYRSDHFSLARVGVPAFSVNLGRKFKGRTVEWGEQQAKEYNEKHYHQPSDEFDPQADYIADQKIGQFGFALGWRAASLPSMVTWQPGDEFEAARKQSQASAK